MRVLKRTDRSTIVDHFLKPRDFELVPEYAARSDYARNPCCAIAGFHFGDDGDVQFWN